MSESLDVMISFVILIIGLSMTLQLVMNGVKNVLGLRWKVYEAYLAELYSDHLGKPVKRGDIKTKGTPIQTVTHRMESFAKRLKTLYNTVAAARAELLKLQSDLAAVDESEKAQWIQDQLEERVPQIRIFADKIRALHVENLLSIYCQLDDSESDDTKQVLSKVSSYVARIDHIVADIRSVMKEQKTELVDQIEKDLKEVVDWFELFDQKVTDLHRRVDTGLEDALRQLEQRYANKIQIWSFVIGFLLCFGLNADSMMMYRDLQNDPNLVHEVIAHTEKLNGVTGTPSRTEALNELMAEAGKVEVSLARTSMGDSDSEDALKSDLATFQSNFDQLCDLIGHDALTFSAQPGVEGNIKVDVAAIKKPIAQACDLAASGKSKEAISRIRHGMGMVSKQVLDFESEKINARVRYLTDSGLPLGWEEGRRQEFLDGPLDKLFGVLLTALMISFGAPFWNDVLKSLMGVKTLLRKKTASASTEAPPAEPAQEPSP